jgi:hypothetical protein
MRNYGWRPTQDAWLQQQGRQLYSSQKQAHGENMKGQDSIFLIQADRTLTELPCEAYESEDILQRYLEDYPDLIPGGQMSDGEPLRWLLVSREHGVPAEAGGNDRWSIDHVFLDQYGVPTLVEVKRATDTRARREVVAQMLDYAANGVVYWPASKLKDRFLATCEARSLEPASLMADHLSAEDDEDSFWERVKSNLDEGRVRLLFVADRIPLELLRIVEFLNVQMSPAMVLALEIKKYASADITTLVPRVLGQTAGTRTRKASKAGTTVTEEQWWDSFAALYCAETVETAKLLANKLAQIGDVLHPTKAGGSLSLGVERPEGGYTYFVFIERDRPQVWLGLGYLSYRAPFASEESRQQLVNRLRDIPGAKITPKALVGAPAVPIANLHSSAVSKFVAIVQEIADALKSEKTDLR